VVFLFVQLLFEKFLVPINIHRITFEVFANNTCVSSCNVTEIYPELALVGRRAKTTKVKLYESLFSSRCIKKHRDR